MAKRATDNLKIACDQWRDDYIRLERSTDDDDDSIEFLISEAVIGSAAVVLRDPEKVRNMIGYLQTWLKERIGDD